MLKSRQELIDIRKEYAKYLTAQQHKILVCAGTGCIASGSLKVYAEFKRLLEQKGLPCLVELKKENEENGISVKKTGCQGLCEMGPLVTIEPEGFLYMKVQVSDCEEIIEKTVLNGEHIARLAFQKGGIVRKKQSDIPYYQKQTRIMLEHCGHIDATSIKEYIAVGGYTAFEKALFEMGPDDIVKTISDSNLRGRGGGGFPTGRKWSQVARQKSPIKYIVCNGDEGDPGAFMDRSVMEGDPHTDA